MYRSRGCVKRLSALRMARTYAVWLEPSTSEQSEKHVISQPKGTGNLDTVKMPRRPVPERTRFYNDVQTLSHLSQPPVKLEPKLENSDKDEFGKLAGTEDIENHYHRYEMKRSSSKLRLAAEHLEEDLNDEDADYKEFIPRGAKRDDPQWYADECKRLGDEGKLAECVAMLERRMLQEDGVWPNYHNFRVVLEHLGPAGHCTKAFQLFQLMKNKYNINPSISAYKYVLRACGLSPVPEQGLRYAKILLDTRDEQDYPRFTIAHYHSLIRIFAKVGDLESAMRMLYRMRAEGIRPTSLTFTHLMHVCSRHRNGFKHAIKLWKLQQQLQVQPILATYTQLLLAVKDGVRPDFTASDKPLSVRTVEKAKSLPPPTLTDPVWRRLAPAIGATLDYPLYQGKTAELTHKQENPVDLSTPESRFSLIGGIPGVIASMKRHDCVPNNVHFATMFNLMPNSTETEHQILHYMEECGLKPDIRFLALIARKRALRNDFNIGEIVEYLPKYQLVPDVRFFGALALACKGRADGLQMLHDMQAMGLEPNDYVLVALMYRALYKLDFFFANKVLDSMEECKIKLNQDAVFKIENSLERALTYLRGGNLSDPDGRKRLFFPHKTGNPGQYFRDYKMFLRRYDNLLRSMDLKVYKRPWDELNEAIDNIDSDDLRKEVNTKIRVRYN